MPSYHLNYYNYNDFHHNNFVYPLFYNNFVSCSSFLQAEVSSKGRQQRHFVSKVSPTVF